MAILSRRNGVGEASQRHFATRERFRASRSSEATDQAALRFYQTGASFREIKKHFGLPALRRLLGGAE